MILFERLCRVLNDGFIFLDPCNGVDCGNGTCSLDGDNEPVCTCDAGSILINEVCVEGGLFSVNLLHLLKPKCTRTEIFACSSRCINSMEIYQIL